MSASDSHVVVQELKKQCKELDQLLGQATLDDTNAKVEVSMLQHCALHK